MEKSPDAFRTISEVADELEVPAHVLRFWESRFPQIKPVKRAGGRRYYRRADIELLDGIRRLLHDDGMTIRGVQKVLREGGLRALSGQPGEADGPGDGTVIDATAADPAPAGRPETATPVNATETRPATQAAVPAPRIPTPPPPDSGMMRPPAPAPATDAAPASPAPPEDSALPEDDTLPAGPLAAAATTGPVPPAVIPEAPMAADVEPDEEESRVLPFARPSHEPARPAEPAHPDHSAPDDVPADRPAPPPRRPDSPEIGPDPEDDDPAFAAPPLDLRRITADADRLRPLYDRLTAIRRKLGDPVRRGPPL